MTEDTTNQWTLTKNFLQPGTQVLDKNEENPEQSPMRVINPDNGQANKIKVNGEYVCNHTGNDSYPENDTVVVVAYESELNAAVNGWREMLDGNFTEELEAFREKWSVYPTTYSFPKSRLEITNK